ncbi:MAG: spore coat protein CotJB [Clostridia bacterium]|nr:spore coat protein CotJB [Clostridia bacterium]
MNTHKNSSLHALAFALYETALYLDGHPNDRRAIEYYDKTRAQYEKELEKYERENGPVTMNSDAATKNGTWQWVNTPWPWQNEYHKS